ncbi:MAG TPA: hypothetical protein VFQ61_13035, partial [Polyangiaceae bacterium]|nr:hypothetical protein [Polyangiaceae bacterium]
MSSDDAPTALRAVLAPAGGIWKAAAPPLNAADSSAHGSQGERKGSNAQHNGSNGGAAAGEPGVSAGAPEGSHLVVEHLVRQFGDYVALSDVNLSIGRGHVAVIIGGSGAGKTTL